MPDRPPIEGCPYRCLRDPLVAATVQAWSWWEKGQLEVYAPDPPAVLVEALTIYEHERARSESWEMARVREDNTPPQR